MPDIYTLMLYINMSKRNFTHVFVSDLNFFFVFFLTGLLF